MTTKQRRKVKNEMKTESENEEVKKLREIINKEIEIKDQGFYFSDLLVYCLNYVI